ncbi:MAG: hypothetical protein NTZ37_02610 [Methanoregula sp.]|nr:hypothetical protein [Methanoregula sp.]
MRIPCRESWEKTLAMGNFRDTGSIFIASSGEIIASDLFYNPVMDPAGS